METLVNDIEKIGKPRLYIAGKQRVLKPEQVRFLSFAGNVVSAPSHIEQIVLKEESKALEFNSWELTEPLAIKYFALLEDEKTLDEYQVYDIDVYTPLCESAAFSMAEIKRRGATLVEEGDDNYRVQAPIDLRSCKSVADIDRAFRDAAAALWGLGDRTVTVLGGAEATQTYDFNPGVKVSA